jgi:hypothetical protein
MDEGVGRPAKEKRDADRPSVGVCAVCGRPRDPRYAPFCSRRCADVDLHRWLTGRYVVAGAAPEEGEGEG